MTHHHKPEARPGIPAVRSFKVYHSKLLELLVIIEVPSTILQSLVKGGVESNAALTWEHKTIFGTLNAAAHEEGARRRSGSLRA